MMVKIKSYTRTTSYIIILLPVLSNMLNILKNNILSYYSKALMHLCKLILYKHE